MRNGGFARSGEVAQRGPYSLADDVRATFAAEQEEERRDRLGTANGVVLVAAIMAAVLLYVFLITRLHPFRFWDAVCLVTTALLPTELALACFFVKDHPVAVAAAWARVGKRMKGTFERLEYVAGVLVFAVMLPTYGVLYLNQALDGSPAMSQELVVQRLWSTSSRHGTTWYAGVVPTARPPLRFTTLYADEPIAVPRRLWHSLEPGRSTLTLQVHPGVLGLAWYEGAPGAGSPTAAAVPSSH